jgi:hypothetical protein
MVSSTRFHQTTLTPPPLRPVPTLSAPLGPRARAARSRELRHLPDREVGWKEHGMLARPTDSAVTCIGESDTLDQVINLDPNEEREPLTWACALERCSVTTVYLIQRWRDTFLL